MKFVQTLFSPILTSPDVSLNRTQLNNSTASTFIMKDSQVQVLPSLSNSRDNLVFENKLAVQDKSFLNRTFTYDSNKRERLRQFTMEDAIRGFLPRAKSSGPRSSYKEDRNKLRSTKEYFSCTLPSLDNGHTKAANMNKCCTLRPWSRTQEELRKYKQTLAGNAPAANVTTTHTTAKQVAKG